MNSSVFVTDVRNGGELAGRRAEIYKALPAAVAEVIVRPIGSVLLSCLFSFSVGAATASWEWRTEDRIALRTSRAAAEARLRRLNADARASLSLRTVDVIDGRREPHLFLPTELFESLVRRGFVGETWRDLHEEDVRRAGLPPDFWDRLAIVAAPFIADLRRTHEILDAARNRSAAERDAANARAAGLYPTLCRHRAEALARARHEFGIALDRFLYMAIAPGSTLFSDMLPDADVLRAAEKGCR